jgi:hypothetical protein
VPYFGWARQDRKDKPRVSIAAKLVADLLSKAGIDRLITMDLHADQIQGFFNVPVDHLYASSVFIPFIKKMKLDEYSQKCAELLSGEVNSLMSGTKIQMFDVQKNGERKPSCIITNNEGVKYSTLNFSARILANIEISRLFCHLLDVSVPCFVDECSVFDSNHLPTIDGTQMIYMRCSDDQKLVVL